MLEGHVCGDKHNKTSEMYMRPGQTNNNKIFVIKLQWPYMAIATDPFCDYSATFLCSKTESSTHAISLSLNCAQVNVELISMLGAMHTTEKHWSKMQLESRLNSLCELKMSHIISH